MNKSLIDRLYVDPAEQQKGWGNRLLAFAKELRPDGQELYTHQQNHVACRFYERYGFIAVRFGINPPPELALDVFYRWSP